MRYYTFALAAFYASFTLTCSSSHATPLDGLYFLQMHPEPGDWVGRGQDYLFTNATGTFRAGFGAPDADDTAPLGTNFAYIDASHLASWGLYFVAGGTGGLYPGEYAPAVQLAQLPQFVL